MEKIAFFLFEVSEYSSQILQKVFFLTENFIFRGSKDFSTIRMITFILMYVRYSPHIALSNGEKTKIMGHVGLDIFMEEKNSVLKKSSSCTTVVKTALFTDF